MQLVGAFSKLVGVGWTIEDQFLALLEELIEAATLAFRLSVAFWWRSCVVEEDHGIIIM